MVSSLKIVFMCISMAIDFLLPLFLIIYACKKLKTKFLSVGIGALMFLLFALIIESTLLSLLGTTAFYKDMSKNIIFFGTFAGFSAGLFEETGRLVGFKFLLKKNHAWKDGLGYGIGHGGLEAMVIGGLSMINYLIYSLFINSKTFDSTIAPLLSANVAEQLKTSLISQPDYTFLLSGIERISAVGIQLGLSLVVLYAVKERKYIYYVAAILLHMLVDTPVVIMQGYNINIFIIELYAFILAIISVIFVIKSKSFFDKEKNIISEVQV